MKNSTPALSIYDRFALYAQKAVNQGAFIPVKDLLERFFKATKCSVHNRQKDRYRKQLKELGPQLGLRFEYISAEHGKKLYVASAEKTFFNPDHQKEDDIIYSFLKTVKASSSGSSKVYAVLRGISKSSQSTLERIVRALKSRAKELGLFFFKKGRELHAKFMKKKAWENTPQKGDIYFYNRKAKDFKYKHTPNGEVQFSSKPMRKKAFFLMRQLKRQFYDNIKVKICEPMLFRFCEWAIQNGFEEQKIERIFNHALLERHKDATDMGLNKGVHRFMFEMSSTVSLAKQLMSKDSLTVRERWQNLKKKGLFKRKKVTDKPKEEVCETPTNHLEQGMDSGNASFGFPSAPFSSYSGSDEGEKPETFLMGPSGRNIPPSISKGFDVSPVPARPEPKTTEEEEEAFLLNNGFQKPHIELFRKFQQKRLHGAEAKIGAKYVVKMGLLLAER